MAGICPLPAPVPTGMPTVREHDGLALSSRNVFLAADDRAAALSLSRGLMAAADAVDAGERDAVHVSSIRSSRRRAPCPR